VEEERQVAFRRQDIPKTTRKSDKGGPRRLYPRYIRDLAPLPKIELAIGYLDEMIGRRRSELSPEVILDLFGDLKLARCLLACLSESYRYRSPELADVVGDEAALALAAWDLFTPADLRAHVYATANRERNGVVADAERADFLTTIAGPLGLSGTQLGELLHLDAERNQILIRVGPRPNAADVAARYNALLTLSILRLASSVELTLPGLDSSTIDVVCSRDEVAYRKLGPETVRLHGRRGTTGGWAGFGGRLARAAVHLIAACPRMPEGQAIVHLGDEPLAFALDAKAVTPLRPKARAVAGAGGAIQAAALVESVAVHRRKGGGRTNGWTVRRTLEPLVVEGVLAMPELTLVRGEIAVALVPVPPGGRSIALAAVERVAATGPVIALGQTGSTVVPALPSTDVEELLELLEEVAGGHGVSRSPLAVVGVELDDSGWVLESRLVQLLGPEANLDERLTPLTGDGEAAYVPGVGLCRIGILEDLTDRFAGGELDIPALRAATAEHVGVGPHADTLTLYVLGQRPVLISQPHEFTDRPAAAA
jgi:hypothetical protein